MTILDDLRAAIEQTKPIVWYATHDALTPGKAFRIASDGFYPDLWIFHPSDFEAQRGELAQHCRLMDFRTWQPTQEDIERAAKAWFDWQREQPILLRDEDEQPFRLWRRPGAAGG